MALHPGLKDNPYSVARHPGCCGCSEDDPFITMAYPETMITMPPVIDRCVKKVKADLLRDKPDLDPKKAESRAWAICRKQLQLQRSQEHYRKSPDDIIQLQHEPPNLVQPGQPEDLGEKLRAKTQAIMEGMKVHGVDPTRTWNLRKQFTIILVMNLRRALSKILDNIPVTMHLSQRGQLIQMQNVQTTLDQWLLSIEVELLQGSEDDIERFISQAFSRGKTQTASGEKQRGRTDEEIPPPSVIPTFSPDRASIIELEALTFDLVKGVNDDMAKDLSRIIRANALGEWDRLTVRNQIVQAIQGTEKFKPGTPLTTELHRYEQRAKMIAHTETVRAFNAGAMSRISSVSEKFELITADNPCPICEVQSLGNPHRVDDPNAPIPPLHPRCQCTVGAYFG